MQLILCDSEQAAATHPRWQEAHHQPAVLQAPLPTHGKPPTSPPWTVPNYSLASPNLQKKKNTSMMKKLRKHSQLKQQENSPKAVNNETDLCSLTESEFKREIVKILKELREDKNSNADSFRKELENIRRSQEKLENSFAEIKTKLKAIKTIMNNAEEQMT